MSKRPHNSPAPALELWERLEAAIDDPQRLREIFESTDTASIAAAVAAKLAGGSSSTSNGSKRRKKARNAHNRPCRLLPAETFLEVVLFADRDTLDAMQLVCGFLLNFIREREHAQLALRAIPEAKIGSIAAMRSYTADLFDVDGWLPHVGMSYKKRSIVFHVNNVRRLTSGFRMAFSESVCVDLCHCTDGTPEADAAFNDVCGMVFDSLVASNAFAGTLNIRLDPRKVEWAIRAIETFKSVKDVNVNWAAGPDLELSAENFLISAAQRGVRRVEFEWTFWDDIAVNTVAALSFGFAEPTAGGDRSLFGIDCTVGSDFLAQVKQKTAELNETRNIDFTFKLANISADIYSAGFEKYQRDEGRTWFMNDLENHVNVEVKQTESLVEIHVSSA